MTIYFLLLLFWFLLYLAQKEMIRYFKIKNTKLIYTIISGFMLLLIMGLRHPTVGADTENYLFHYNNITSQFDLHFLRTFSEWGFVAFNMIIKNFLNLDNQQYLFLTSMIIVISFMSFFYRYSANIFLSLYLHVTIGLFAMSLTGLRQILAICLFMLAFYYMEKKKLIFYLIVVASAYFVHNSALVLIPIYFIRNINLNFKKALFVFVSTVSLLFFRIYLTPIMQFILPQRYDSRYELVRDVYPINPLVILVSLLIPAVCLVFWNIIESSSIKEKNKFSIFYVFACLSASFNILALNSSIISRMAFYFIPFIVVLIPNLISKFRNIYFRTLAIMFCLFLPMIQFIKSTPGTILKIDIFKFFWQ